MKTLKEIEELFDSDIVSVFRNGLDPNEKPEYFGERLHERENLANYRNDLNAFQLAYMTRIE